MIDLHDAWTWYVTTRTQLKLFGRLGRKHWDELPWDGTLGKDEKSRLRHALIIQIVTDATDEIEHGSFYRVLQVFKGLDANLIEEVNQVRKYRNWVAHGRRTGKPDAVDPETAFGRLKEFLVVLGIRSTDGP